MVMSIWSFFKRPKDKILKEEVGKISSGGARSIVHDSQAMGLTPEYLATLLISAANNDIAAYLTLAEEMEERDLHYAGVLSTRKIAVSKLPVKLIAPSEDPQALRIADEARLMLDSIRTRRLTKNMLDALGKGFSAIEIIWDTSSKQWQPKELKWRDPRFFMFDTESQSVLRLRDESDLTNGLELSPFKWIVHYPEIKTGIPIRGGLARLASFAHMCKSYTLKDWLAFAEVFGMPIRVGTYPASATVADQAKLMTAVASLGTDAAAILPDSMSIEFVAHGNSSSGGAMFRELADYLDKQISKGVLGQTMTTDNGSSLAQAKVHEEVRQDIVDSDATEISESLTMQLIKPWVVLNYGDSAPCPKVQISIPKQEDLKTFSDSVSPLIDRGLPVEIAQVLDKFGLVEPAKDAPILQPKDRILQEPVVQRALRALNRASDRDLVDDLVDVGLRDWKKQVDPMIAPILEAASRSTTYEEFENNLEGVIGKMDTGYFVKRLATTMFMGRGLGDATDEV